MNVGWPTTVSAPASKRIKPLAADRCRQSLFQHVVCEVDDAHLRAGAVLRAVRRAGEQRGAVGEAGATGEGAHLSPCASMRLVGDVCDRYL